MSMTFEEKVAAVLNDDEEILTVDGCDDAFLGIVHDWNNGARAVYDLEKVIVIYQRLMACDHDEAAEYVSFNVTGAYVGEKTPLFLEKP